MKKIQIIILAVAGIVSFAGAFGVTMLLRKSQPVLPETSAKAVGDTLESGAVGFGQPDLEVGGDRLAKSMALKQLQNLIYDIREKMKEHKNKEKELAQQEERIVIARDILQEDIKRLEALRMQLTTTLSNLKQQQANLKHSIIEITVTEKANMERIAGRYDNMKPASAGPIIVEMAANNQLKDAVMILYYMDDKKAAKLLSGIDSKLAALLCDRLKRVKESG